jgi:acid phosphatase (class A)
LRGKLTFDCYKRASGAPGGANSLGAKEMGGPRTIFAMSVGLLLLAGAAPAGAAGYLDASKVPDMYRVLPPPPAAGGGAEAEDKRAFVVTRALKDSPRWAMATNDVEQSPEAAFLDFACSLGVTLDDGTAPTLQNIFTRIRSDARPFVDPPKDKWARPRPYLSQNGDICVEKTDALAKSAAYPSGHATLSWAWGLILAELAPDRATEILARARAYSESRVVCGVHYPSDIEAGRQNGSALYSALQTNAEFRADMEKAKAEIAAARAKGSPAPNPDVCKVEAEAESHRPW